MIKNKKLIFALLDGLKAQVAKENMGFLNHLVDQKMAAYYTVRSEIPAMSKPLYEVLMSGIPSVENKVVSNDVVKQSNTENIFELCRKSGLKTGASAYYWMSELYNHIPFDKSIDTIQLDNKQELIQDGFFYFEDQYPDSHVISGGNYLINNKDSDFVLIHTMNIDYAGHLYGANSKEYTGAAIKSDSMLSEMILQWVNSGIDIIVTADHGMSDFGFHNGITKDDRYVPLYIISKMVDTGDYADILVPQVEIAPLICKLLGIKKSEMMVDVSKIRMKD